MVEAFPHTPYGIQRDFMLALYETLERGQIGLFESPTGVNAMWHELAASRSRSAACQWQHRRRCCSAVLCALRDANAVRMPPCPDRARALARLQAPARR